MESERPHPLRTDGKPGGAGAPGTGRSGRAAVALLGLSVVVYVLLFPSLHRALGSVVPAVSIFVPVLGGALLGWRWGAALGFLCMPLNVSLLAWAGDSGVFTPVGHAMAAVVYAAIGVVVGRLRELAAVLRRTYADELQGVLAGARQAQQTLTEREAQLAQAQAMTHIGYWVVDLESRTATWSAELCGIMGEDPATARPSIETWWQHIHPEDRAMLERNAARGMSDDAPVQDEFRLVRSDGTLRCVFGRAQTLRDETGKPIKLLGTVQDVTEQKELQAQLAAAERLATVGTLAAGVAHEINNPLASLISNVEFVLEDLRRIPPDPPERAAALQAAVSEALQGADRVSRIIHDLLLFARPREEPGPVDVERVLDLSVNMAAPQTRYRARVVKQYGRVPPATGDASRLGQVFLNLLVNAAQAIPASRPSDHEIRITTRLEGVRVAVSVRDTGTGMTPEVKRRIFEPFFTTRPLGSGVGLGLSTSLAAVRSMGGDITVESMPGKGSTFTVTLPVLGLEPSQATPMSADSSSGRSRILIIDDEPLVVAQVARELVTEHEVRYAPDGRAGIEQIASGGFDAILCDLEMPGLSGMDVHEQVRRRDPEIAARIVFLTDGAFTPASRAFLAATRSRIMAKPVAAEAVRKLLRSEPRRG